MVCVVVLGQYQCANPQARFTDVNIRNLTATLIKINLTAKFSTKAPVTIRPMDEKELSAYFAALGRKGARKRAARLSAEERRQIATKAGKASGRARKKKAKAKKKRG